MVLKRLQYCVLVTLTIWLVLMTCTLFILIRHFCERLKFIQTCQISGRLGTSRVRPQQHVVISKTKPSKQDCLLKMLLMHSQVAKIPYSIRILFSDSEERDRAKSLLK